MFLTAPASDAATYYWQTSAGDWSNASCWGGTLLPTLNDTAYIDNGGTATVSQNIDEAMYLYVGDTTGSGALKRDGRQAYCATRFVSAGSQFTQSGGLNSMYATGQDYGVYLGYNPNDTGQYNLSAARFPG